MNRISSRLTFFTKRVFPTFWFGFTGLFFLVHVVQMVSGRDVPIVFLVQPALMAGFGYLIMRNLVFDLVDEVWDAGSELLVKNGGRQARVALTEITNISYSVSVNPARVTLTLRQPTNLGREITFAAPTTWIPFAKSPIIENLIQRVDVARGGRS